MTLTELFKYEVGEEVVVRLGGATVVEAGEGTRAASALPDWTIAEIVRAVMDRGAPSYDVRFRHLGRVHGCTVPEEAIEGTA